jgi:outer membrane murein-binding lipoprotein Lpp
MNDVMKSEEVSVVRPDHDTTENVIDEVHVFEPGYQPEQLPKLDMPDLDANVQSLTASELAQVPTLIDQVTPSPQAMDSDAKTDTDVAAEAEMVSSDVLVVDESESITQVPPVQADQMWELFHVRMDALTTDIKKLNDRLDQLESKSKV